MPTLGEIISLPHTDYEYRAYCTHEQWAAALAKIALDIDYVKFKETTESKYHDRKLHDMYLALWSKIFSSLSTQRHQDEYWRPITRRRQPVLSDLVGTVTRVGDDGDLDGRYAEITVIRDAHGRIDHTWCEHGDSRNAKRRCQRRNAR
jgi:hypothetical protein